MLEVSMLFKADWNQNYHCYQINWKPTVFFILFINGCIAIIISSSTPYDLINAGGDKINIKNVTITALSFLGLQFM